MWLSFRGERILAKITRNDIMYLNKKSESGCHPIRHLAAEHFEGNPKDSRRSDITMSAAHGQAFGFFSIVCRGGRSFCSCLLSDGIDLILSNSGDLGDNFAPHDFKRRDIVHIRHIKDDMLNAYACHLAAGLNHLGGGHCPGSQMDCT